jgi:putative ABC transport system permease protein
MGNYMELLKYFGVIMFILLMYLLSKQIIEKNSQSISMTKILGFSNGEIAGLYIVATSVVVIISLLISIPITNYILQLIFNSYLYTMITGYIPYSISNSCFIEMFILGIISYGIVALLQIHKIKKIPKSDALKNVE